MNNLLHNDEVHKLHASRSIVRTSKLRGMLWAGHVPPMEQMRNAYKNLVGKHEETTLKVGR